MKIRHAEIVDAADDLERLKANYLRERGWSFTCDYPGSYWMWERVLPDGRRIAVSTLDSAVRMQFNLGPDVEDDDER